MGDKGGSYQDCENNIFINSGYVGVQLQGGSFITVANNQIYSDLLPWSGGGLIAANYTDAPGVPAANNTIRDNTVNWLAGYLGMGRRDTAYKAGTGGNTLAVPIGWSTNTVRATSLDGSVLPTSLLLTCSVPVVAVPVKALLTGDQITLTNKTQNAKVILQTSTKDTVGFGKNMGGGQIEYHKVQISDIPGLSAKLVSGGSGMSKFNNGLDTIDGYGGLGGGLIRDTHVETGGNSLDISGTALDGWGYGGFTIDGDKSSYLHTAGTFPPATTYVGTFRDGFNTPYVKLQADIDAFMDGSPIVYDRITSPNSLFGYHKGWTVQNDRDSIGFLYGADYSKYGKRYNNWIASWGAIKYSLDSLHTAITAGLSGSYLTPASPLAWAKVTGAPAFITGLSSFSTTNLAEGTNLYWTTARGDARYPQLSGSYTNPGWITNLPWSKITGAPAFITGYTETDPLVPAYAKGLTAFSVIKGSTDALYYPLSGNPSSFELSSNKVTDFSVVDNSHYTTVQSVWQYIRSQMDTVRIGPKTGLHTTYINKSMSVINPGIGTFSASYLRFKIYGVDSLHNRYQVDASTTDTVHQSGLPLDIQNIVKVEAAPTEAMSVLRLADTLGLLSAKTWALAAFNTKAQDAALYQAKITGTGNVYSASGVITYRTAVKNEVPSGSVNGSNTTFTLTHVPISGTVEFWYNGMLQSPANYTVSGTTFTTSFAPGTTSGSGTILISYNY